VPQEDLIWQDPVPAGRRAVRRRHRLVQAQDPWAPRFKRRPAVKTAWASASTYRRPTIAAAPTVPHRLEPQRGWAVNEPEELGRVLAVIDGLRGPLSMADAIVLAARRRSRRRREDAGFTVEVPFVGGRGDATQDWTDAESFAVMEPVADGFRNYLKTKHSVKTEELLLDRASLLGLSVPEMTVLLGGLRVLGANYQDRPEGVFTDRKGQLTNHYFVNLLDNATFWKVIDESATRSSSATTAAAIARNGGRPAPT
jgi:catalase-peroxidase